MGGTGQRNMQAFIAVASEMGLGDLVPRHDDPQGERVDIVIEFEEGVPLSTMEVGMWFPADNTLRLSTGVIVPVSEPRKKMKRLLGAVNWLNQHLRWVSVWLDADRNVHARADTLLSDADPGHDAMRLFELTIVTCADIRGTVMRAIAGDADMAATHGSHAPTGE